MPLIVPDSFALMLLNSVVLNSTNAYGIKQSKVKLFSNDYTPTRSSTTGDLTEASFTGYAAQSVNEFGWTVAAIVSGTPQVSYDNAPGFTFTATSGGGQLIYGYWIENDSILGNFLQFAERFDTPRLIAPGVPLVLLLNFTLKSQYPET